jgi:hypothetical protein
MSVSSEQAWGDLYTIGADDGEELRPEAVAKLVELKIAEYADDGQPRLTPYGEKCFVVMESGDGNVPELNDIGDG